MPNNLDHLADLVSRFSAALLDKLRAAEVKYGRKDDWTHNDWRESLCRQIAEHVTKGDPLDVAAYAAFAWHHGWSVAPARLTAQITASGGEGLITDARP